MRTFNISYLFILAALLFAALHFQHTSRQADAYMSAAVQQSIHRSLRLGRLARRQLYRAGYQRECGSLSHRKLVHTLDSHYGVILRLTP